MKSRSRWFRVTPAAVALGLSLLSLPCLTPASSSMAYQPQLLAAVAPPVIHTSWQGVLMAGASNR